MQSRSIRAVGFRCPGRAYEREPEHFWFIGSIWVGKCLTRHSPGQTNLLRKQQVFRIIRLFNELERPIVPDPDENKSIYKLTQTGRYIIIIAAFLGWFFGGMHLGITSLSMGSAAKDLLRGTGQFEVAVAARSAAQQQFEEAREYFSESQLANLTLAIATINAWNRFAVGFRNVHPTPEKAAAA